MGNLDTLQDCRLSAGRTRRKVLLPYGRHCTFPRQELGEMEIGELSANRQRCCYSRREHRSEVWCSASDRQQAPQGETNGGYRCDLPRRSGQCEGTRGSKRRIKVCADTELSFPKIDADHLVTDSRLRHPKSSSRALKTMNLIWKWP